ncbi:hypothetical protein RvY_16518 [Ramazzottius varieornatus]|uniref:Transcription initiation factor TFIID subunit 1 n=1 Tax=Ramazzottius varieornatus TaxID=947166 RepID=A0A1D1VYR4_RAMVA|nr:hypothetical protein RvY_16518 [Ramazzottius varieornatus]
MSLTLHEESPDRDDEDGNASDQPFSLTNFLFGNVSESGSLESDYLDEEAKEHLSNLSSGGLNVLSTQIKDVSQEVASDEESKAQTDGMSCGSGDAEQKSPSAVDFFDFDDTEMKDDYDAVDLDETIDQPSVQGSDPSSSDEVIPDSLVSSQERGIHPLTTSIEHVLAEPESKGQSEASEEEPDTVEPSSQNSTHSIKLQIDESTQPAEDGASVDTESASFDSSDSTQTFRSLNTPLASVLPPELASIDVTDVFPEFRPDKTLRFSRIFTGGRPSSLPKRWKKKLPPRPVAFHDVPSLDSEVADDEDEDEAAILERMLEEPWPIYSRSAEKEIPVDVSCAEESSQDGPVLTIVENADETVTVEHPNPSGVSEEIKEPEKPKDLTSEVIPSWRYGPARHWYDQLDVDPTGAGFDYGARQKKREAKPQPPSFPYGTKASLKVPVPDEALLMVALTHWESNIIWDGVNHKREVEKLLADKRTVAGWIPSNVYRTASSFLAPASKGGTSILPPPLDLKNDSMFPPENEDLLNGNWEKDIIWDPEDVDNLPEPTVLMLDPNDPNIVIGIPDEEEYEMVAPEPVTNAKEGKEKKDSYKRTSGVLRKAGISKDQPSSPKPHDEIKSHWKDPFNLSNDEYYSPKVEEGNLKTTTGAVAIQHSIPAVQFYGYFFPTNLTLLKLRNYHRPGLKKYSNGTITMPGAHPVETLAKIIKKKAKEREQERVASGGGEMFFMRTPEDLSAMDGEIVLAEYSEEHPPLISQIGMATRIKNYFKRKPKEAEDPPKFDYGGDVVYAHTSPFLGALAPGQAIQAFENNMFRAPIYQHQLSSTDFLIIRTRNHYYIREIPTIFTVGQESPLTDVPAPNSKKSTNFQRDFLQAHIYRAFWKSIDTPRKVRTDEIKKLFTSTQSESTLRKRLKMCADFHRSGPDSQWWILRPDFRLPSEEEIRDLCSPEDYCAYYSMRSAEQRLKDAGYGEKLILATEDDGDEEQQSKMDDEIKAAPWNTTRAYISAVRGKCILQLTGNADPTGRGEGFSYVRIASSKADKEGPPLPKRTVTGTDADLRKLSLSKAKDLLRAANIAEDRIKKLSRWEIIDLVRFLGTQQSRGGNEEQMSKFARGNKYSFAEQQQKYKEESQRIFELQNRILGSDEVLSTDEESSDEEEDEDMEKQGRNLEIQIQSKKSHKELLFEREEEERKELKKLLNKEEADEKDRKQKQKVKKAAGGAEATEEAPAAPTRRLKITRTFTDPEGRKFDRTEIVSRPALIDAYIRIRSKDENFIRQFSALDSERKELLRKEKRRKQEQLRRSDAIQKRLEIDEAAQSSTWEGEETSKPKKPKKPKKEKEIKVKCGACGQVGHMKTNKAVCPMAGETRNLVMTEEEESQRFGNLSSDSGLVRVEGNKITVSKTVLNESNLIRQEGIKLRIPKQLLEREESVEPLDPIEAKIRRKEKRDREEDEDRARSGRPKKQRRTGGTGSMPDYLEKPRLFSSRRRVDPVVVLAGSLEEILDEMRDLPGCELFRLPVNPKIYPDYGLIVSDPMDLSTMRKKLNQGIYRSREDFLKDVQLIYANCEKYNGKGEKCTLTMAAQSMVDLCLRRFGQREEVLRDQEQKINPLLHDDDQIALSYLFQQIIEKGLRTVEGSALFHSPVNRKLYPDYHTKIKQPMDFDTMEQKAKSHQYRSKDQFLADVTLIKDNCIKYNGSSSDSAHTRTAEELVRAAEAACLEERDRIAALETAIKEETESSGTHVSDNDRPTTSHSRREFRLDSVFSYSNADMEDDSKLSREDSRSKMASDPPSPTPFTNRTQVSALPSDRFYEDARTGYEEESNHGEPSMLIRNQVSQYDSNEPSMANEDAELKEEPSVPTVASRAALEDDLNLSDSDDENVKSTEKKAPAGEPMDEDDDAFFF